MANYSSNRIRVVVLSIYEMYRYHLAMSEYTLFSQI